MRERVYRTEALILRRNDMAEADRLLLIATPNGKVRVVAKGVRKISSRLAGHIELFTHASLLLAVGRNLDIVTQSQAINTFTTLRSDITRLSCAYYVADLYATLTEEGEESRPIFQLLVETFTALDLSINPDLILRSFELHLLQIAGYRPHLHHCAQCGTLLTEEANRFSPLIGGVLCPDDQHSDPRALPMGASAFRLLRYLQTQPMSTLEHLHLSATVRTEVETLLHAYLRHVLERDLKSVAFLHHVMRGE